MRALVFPTIAAALLLAAAPATADPVQRSVLLKAHKFDPAEIHVPAGQRVELTVQNDDATPDEFDSHDLKVEKVIAGGTSGLVRFGPLRPGRYRFEGEYYAETAQGTVVAE
jgi:hypothetical protein